MAFEASKRFLWLWMAHMVQRPGEKPGTAIALRGKGRCGKSTFGLLLQKLVSPYALALAHEENVTGRFANENLSTAILAVCTEALFAGGPGVDGKIKSQVTSPTLMVEPKGLYISKLLFRSVERRTECRDHFALELTT